jgi:nitrite reductase (NO-forming)
MKNDTIEPMLTQTTISRKTFLRRIGGTLALGGILDAAAAGKVLAQGGRPAATAVPPAAKPTRRVAADPLAIPPPIRRSRPTTIQALLEPREVMGEIEPGVGFYYMTFGGQIPGPMIRARQGDTVELTLRNSAENHTAHNIDLHAVYATGGGSAYTRVAPGQSKVVRFKVMYPGAFIYHCAMPRMLDYHISSGMFGMIVVEPPEGLPPVDRELYLGQNEIYTDKEAGQPGFHNFDLQRMATEDPTYVVLNGQKDALTAEGFGEIPARQGEKLRIFFVCGGPNLTCHFHPIGNVWHKAWPQGALANEPARFVQTQPVPPGSCGVFELELPVAQKINLVDHALSRVVHKGMLGVINVQGAPTPAIFQPLA